MSFACNFTKHRVRCSLSNARLDKGNFMRPAKVPAGSLAPKCADAD